MHTVDVSESSQSHVPFVTVSEEAIYNMVEYLAVRRVQAEFSYAGTHFIASFPRMSRDAVQHVMDDWAAFEQSSKSVEEPTHA